MSQFINNPEHTFGFDTLQLHVGQESADAHLPNHELRVP